MRSFQLADAIITSVVLYQISETSSLESTAEQGCQIGHFPAKFRKFDLFQVGWPYDFWVGRLAFFSHFLKVVWPKLFSVGRFWEYVYILKLNCQRQHFFWKSRLLCVRFALCIELQAKARQYEYAIVLAALCRPCTLQAKPLCVYGRIPVHMGAVWLATIHMVDVACNQIYSSYCYPNITNCLCY